MCHELGGTEPGFSTTPLTRLVPFISQTESTPESCCHNKSGLPSRLKSAHDTIRQPGSCTCDGLRRVADASCAPFMNQTENHSIVVWRQIMSVLPSAFMSQVANICKPASETCPGLRSAED